MKLVTAVVKPHAIGEIRDALTALGIHGMTVSEASGYGRQRGHSEVYRGAEYVLDFVPKLRVEVLARDEDAADIVRAIAGVASSGRIGDGKIWVVPVDTVVRVRTGERDEDAI